MIQSFHSSSVEEKPISIRILILPKFEKGSFETPAIGEGQLFYDHYFREASSYELPSFCGGGTLYVSGNMALCLTGICKVQSSNTLTALLLDPRFDFTDCYILSVGCAGGNPHTTVLGDVVLASSTVDYDLGHHFDIREMESSPVTWYREKSYDEIGMLPMNANLINQCMSLLGSLPFTNSPQAEQFMIQSFGFDNHLLRAPRVVRGTIESSDNYWKGTHDSEKAEYIAASYRCPDPFCASEMEDHALALVCKRFNLLDHYLALRGIVNMTCFGKEDTPFSLWSEHSNAMQDFGIESETEIVFEQVMQHVFAAGSTIIRAIIENRF